MPYSAISHMPYAIGGTFSAGWTTGERSTLKTDNRKLNLASLKTDNYKLKTGSTGNWLYWPDLEAGPSPLEEVNRITWL